MVNKTQIGETFTRGQRFVATFGKSCLYFPDQFLSVTIAGLIILPLHTLHYVYYCMYIYTYTYHRQNNIAVDYNREREVYVKGGIALLK